MDGQREVRGGADVRAARAAAVVLLEVVVAVVAADQHPQAAARGQCVPSFIGRGRFVVQIGFRTPPLGITLSTANGSANGQESPPRLSSECRSRQTVTTRVVATVG